MSYESFFGTSFTSKLKKNVKDLAIKYVSEEKRNPNNYELDYEIEYKKIEEDINKRIEELDKQKAE